MQILVDATALYGRFGGIETALWHTLREWKFVAPKVIPDGRARVFVPADAPDFLTDDGVLRFERLPFCGAQKMRRIWWQQFQLPLLARNADVLWAPTYVCPLLPTAPVVLGVPDLIALNQPRFATRANRIHYRLILPRSLSKAARIITTTERVKNDVLRRVPSAHVHVAPLGVEEEFRREIPLDEIANLRQKYDLPPRFLLYVGNFEPKKNLPNLLRAVRGTGIPLVVAGGVNAWPQHANLLRGVQKLGFVPREELPILMRAATVFCFPSLCEGFGMPVLEALAVGAPVVASSEVPLPNLEAVARVPNPRSPQQIRREIANLLESESLRREFAEKGRAYAQEFTWRNTARLTLETLRL